MLASSEKAFIKKKNIRLEKRLLENIYWLTSKYLVTKLKSFVSLCRSKTIRYRLFQFILKSTETSTGTEVLSKASTKYRYRGTFIFYRAHLC